MSLSRSVTGRPTLEETALSRKKVARRCRRQPTWLCERRLTSKRPADIVFSIQSFDLKSMGSDENRAATAHTASTRSHPLLLFQVAEAALPLQKKDSCSPDG